VTVAAAEIGTECGHVAMLDFGRRREPRAARNVVREPIRL